MAPMSRAGCRWLLSAVAAAAGAGPAGVQAQFGVAAGSTGLTGMASSLGGIAQPWDASAAASAALGLPAAGAGAGAGYGFAPPAGLPGQAPGFGQLQQQQAPLVIGGVQFSREDDIENMEKLSNLFGQVFYTNTLSPGDAAVEEAWRGLSSDVWALADYAAQVPALALPVAMCLYNYFWWEGPHSLEPNAEAGAKAAELMYIAVKHANCNQPALPPTDYFILQCHLRWRYAIMLAGEVSRYLILQRRDLTRGVRMMSVLRSYFAELRQLPNSGLIHGKHSHEVNFNVDYYPGSVARQGPVWHNPLRDVPIASFLEAHSPRSTSRRATPRRSSARAGTTGRPRTCFARGKPLTPFASTRPRRARCSRRVQK
eukprot:TRINITY_DN4174_c0_g1_i1.p1 TRINITY_DN4174_c0_g1~~TRINITY_DN4174_c0_g1_i1.p1  ORF type:complete len:370 (-),score=67.01 TRINITY_DN4174_c0_g1_i1:482-1591(-)